MFLRIVSVLGGVWGSCLVCWVDIGRIQMCKASDMSLEPVGWIWGVKSAIFEKSRFSDLKPKKIEKSQKSKFFRFDTGNEKIMDMFLREIFIDKLVKE